MQAMIIYESLTKNTEKAAVEIAKHLSDLGVTATAHPRDLIDYQRLTEADIVIVGSWVDGLFFVGQKPAKVSHLRRLPRLDNKKAFVFCTYAIDPGKTLTKMTDLVSGLGAEVSGGVCIKRNEITKGSKKFAEAVAAQALALT